MIQISIAARIVPKSHTMKERINHGPVIPAVYKDKDKDGSAIEG